MRGQGSAWKGRGSRGGGDNDGPSKQICLWWANARLKQQQGKESCGLFFGVMSIVSFAQYSHLNTIQELH